MGVGRWWLVSAASLAGVVGAALLSAAWLRGGGVELLTDEPDTIDMQPTVAPDGKTVAFVRFRALMLLDMPSRTVTPLVVPGVTGIAHPAWSPDGKRLAFSALHTDPTLSEGRGVHLFVMEVASRRWRCLTPTNDFNTRPTWSPDGRKVAFTKSARGTAFLCVYDLERRQLKRLSARWGRSPAWSPDGKTIAFISSDRHSPDVWLMNADGTNSRPLFADERTDEDMPCWTPDGKFVVFTRQMALAAHPDRRDLWAVRVADGKAFPLTRCAPDHWAMAPCVTRDGKFVVFALRRRDHSVLCRIAVDWRSPRPHPIP